MPILATRCPMCSGFFTVVRVASYPLLPAKGSGVFKLAGVNPEGEVCCSYDEFRYATRTGADEAAADWDAERLAEFAAERQDEAMACTDEHGYFMDYGPADSDYYD